MTEVATIQFTQDQTRSLTGVSSETVRHWRKTIPYLSLRKGKAARFSFTDLVGLAVTNELVKSFGVHIARVSTGIDILFRLLAVSSPASLYTTVVFITPNGAILHDAGLNDSGASGKPAIAIPLAPFVTKIQQHMLPAMPVSRQTVLPFSLEAVRSKT